MSNLFSHTSPATRTKRDEKRETAGEDRRRPPGWAAAVTKVTWGGVGYGLAVSSIRRFLSSVLYIQYMRFEMERERERDYRERVGFPPISGVV